MKTHRAYRNRFGKSLLPAVLAILLPAMASAAPFYTVTDLGDLPGGVDFSRAYDINDHGQVVGYSGAATGERGFLWQNGVMTDLGDLPSGPNFSRAYGINDHGQVVGQAGVPSGSHGFLWQNGVMTDLGDLPNGFDSSVARGINNNGQVAGASGAATGQHSFLWQGGVMTDLGDLPGGADLSTPSGINDSGQVVGTGNASTARGFLWQNGVMTDLGSLPGGNGHSVASGINNSGQVVGSSNTATAQHGFLWQGGVMTDLGVLPGTFSSSALGVNDLGQVVGYSGASVFLWDNVNGMLNLNSRLVNPAGWTLFASGEPGMNINTSGQIVGTGTHNGVTRGFLLDPVAAPEAGEPIAFAAELFQASNSPFLSVYNDRAGVGRTFRTVQGDRVRWSANVFPSPDSDVLPFACGTGGALQCVTNNGDLTDVDVLIGTLDLQTFFVGLTSGFGGGPGEYTLAPDRAPLTPEQLAFLDANPVQFQISGDGTPSGPATILRTGPDYDPNAMPGFVNNISMSGGGLTPVINWMIADDPLAAPATGQSIQVRRVSGNVDDGTFRSDIVHVQNLALDATSYTFGSAPFSILPGETGLMEGATYEVSIQRNIVTTAALAANLNRLQGTSRTFFEFTPLADDIGGIQVYLPSVDADGNYHFDFAVTENTPVVIDPIIAIGYDYQIGAAGDPLFASVLLPTLTLDDGLYDIYLWDGDSFDIFLDDALAGIEYFFGGEGVDRFRVLGIDPAAMLDPTDVTAFLTTLTFASSGQFTGTMTPVTFDTDAAPPPPPGPVGVPEPGAITLLGAGLFGLVWARRRRQV